MRLLPNRRWLRFSIRTLLVAIVISFCLGVSGCKSDRNQRSDMTMVQLEWHRDVAKRLRDKGTDIAGKSRAEIVDMAKAAGIVLGQSSWDQDEDPWGNKIQVDVLTIHNRILRFWSYGRNGVPDGGSGDD